mmetsp:Transcript_10596/g.15518  ORF Transcript_10596/g.15518 Transcript_10596/m.15518 type:complete len:661 (-) Transcript_10596:2-1984(-)
MEESNDEVRHHRIQPVEGEEEPTEHRERRSRRGSSQKYNISGSHPIIQSINTYIALWHLNLFKGSYVLRPLRSTSTKLSRLFQWLRVLYLSFEYFGFMVMLLQLLTLTIFPELPYHPTNRGHFLRLSIIRTFHLQMIAINLNDKYDGYTQLSGEILNYYIPSIFIFGFILTFLSLHVLYTCICTKNNWAITKVVSILMHLCSGLTYMLYIPILTVCLRNIVCTTVNASSDVILPNGTCYSGGNIAISTLSFLLLPIFIVLAFNLFLFHLDWRPNSPSYMSRPHSRFICIFVALTSFMVVVHEVALGIFPLKENFLIQVGVCFINLICVVQLLGFHMFFLQFYKTIVNYMIASVLLACLLATILGCMVPGFLWFASFQAPFTDFPGISFVMALILCGIVGSGMVEIRMLALFTSIRPMQSHRLIQLGYGLREDDLFIPRGSFEVEINARYLPRVRSSGYDNNDNGLTDDDDKHLQESITQETSNMIHFRQGRVSPSPLPDNLDDIVPSLSSQRRNELEARLAEFYNSALSIHSHSAYVYLSFATFKAHIQRKMVPAMHLLINGSKYISAFSLDMRIYYLMHFFYWRSILRRVFHSLDLSRDQIQEHLNPSFRRSRHQEEDEEEEENPNASDQEEDAAVDDSTIPPPPSLDDEVSSPVATQV